MFIFPIFGDAKGSELAAELRQMLRFSNRKIQLLNGSSHGLQAIENTPIRAIFLTCVILTSLTSKKKAEA